MTAVVRPISIHNTDLCDGGVPVLFVTEISLQELQVVQIHCKSQFLQQIRKASIIKANKSINSSNSLRCCIFHSQGFGQFQCCLTAFHRIDHMLLDSRNILLSQITSQHIDLSSADDGAVALRDDLNTLRSRVSPLVVLTGQWFYRKYDLTGRNFVAYIVNLRLREHSIDSIAEEAFLNILCIIAVQNTNGRQRVDLQKILNFTQQAVSLMSLAGFLFNIYTIYHGTSPPYLFAASARWPISLLR